MMKLLFLGSNPSLRADSKVPFWHKTSSRRILNKWMEQVLADGSVEIGDVTFLNVSDVPTPKNRPLKDIEIALELDNLESKMFGEHGVRPTHIVALGKTAEKALTLLRIKHFAMPHPSGLNRQMNDKSFIAGKINALKSYLKASS